MIYTDGVHLITDDQASYDELHAFAVKIGLKRCWFQRDHYDLTTRAKASAAAAAGAVLISLRDVGRLSMKTRWMKANPGKEFAPSSSFVFPEGWAVVPLDPALAASKNTEIMRQFAPGRRVGRRGVDHLEGANNG